MRVGLVCGNKIGEMVSIAINPTKVLRHPQKLRDNPDFLNDIDIVLSVHCREIIKKDLLDKIPCFNVHPFLYCYKGADPVGRAIGDKNWIGSVGMHRMTEVVDCGELIIEEHTNILPSSDREEIYLQLYPVYLRVIYWGLKKIERVWNGRNHNPS